VQAPEQHELFDHTRHDAFGRDFRIAIVHNRLDCLRHCLFCVDKNQRGRERVSVVEVSNGCVSCSTELDRTNQLHIH